MGSRILLVGWLFVNAACSAQPTNQTAQTVTVFEGARLIVGDGSPPIEDSAVWVEGDRFVQVGRVGEFQVPADAVRVDLTGKTIMPALVDAHSHIGYMKDLTRRAAELHARTHSGPHVSVRVSRGESASQAMGSDFGVMPFQLRDEILAGQVPRRGAVPHRRSGAGAA